MAVAIVIISHVATHYGANVEIPGKLGVFIFFAISGYIVTKMLSAEMQRDGRINLPNFYLRRALRILPPLIIYVVFCWITFDNTASGIMSGARALLFTCNLNVKLGDCGWTFGHTWSLAFEEQYYLLLPFAFVGIRSLRTLVLFLVAVLLAVLPFLFPLPWIGRIGFLQIYLLLGLGASYAIFEPRVARHLSKLHPSASLTALALACGWMFLDPGRVQALTGLLVAPLIVFAVFGLPLQSRLATRFLSSFPMRTVGLYSYTLYLWQQLALSPADWNTGALPLALLAAAFIWSAVSYHTVEAFCRGLARKRSAGVPSAA